MYIGTDVDIRTCRQEGYPVIECPGSWVKRIKDKDKPVLVTISEPMHWTDGINNRGCSVDELYRVRRMYSFNDIKELFLDSGKGIKDYCDWDHCPIELDNPTGYDMVSLVSIVDMWHSLSN